MTPKRRVGHPVTTGSASTKAVYFRLTRKERAMLELEASAHGMTVNRLSKLRTLQRQPRDEG